MTNLYSPKLITIGHLLKEYIHFPDRIIGPVLGSPAAYSSVTACRLGLDTGIVTRIGTDMPASLYQPIIDAGVDQRGIKTKGNDTRTSILTYAPSGEKKIFYEKTAPSIEPEDIPVEYLAAQAALICPLDFEVSLGTTRFLYDRGLLLMADLGGFGGTVSTTHPGSKAREDQAFLEELSIFCQIIKASLEDCQYLLGPVESAEEAGEALLALGVSTAVVTCGSDGSVIFSGKEKMVIPAFQAEVVDSTGAGDVFCGSFLVEYLKSKDLRAAAIFASAAASLMIESSGGVTPFRMPGLEQVSRRILSGI